MRSSDGDQTSPASAHRGKRQRRRSCIQDDSQGVLRAEKTGAGGCCYNRRQKLISE
jgi:hypothetical protein